VKLDGASYADDLFTEEATRWIRENHRREFFLYLAYTSPHFQYEVPDLGRYAREPWEEAERARAAMVTRLDRDIGNLIALLDDLGVGEDTIIFFSSDNGPRPREERFESTGGLRGRKGRLYEGGIRVPMIVRWPGRVPAKRVSRATWAFWDFLPTCAALTGAELPAGAALDGLPVARLLLGGDAPRREYLYWELTRGRFSQAARFGNMKAVRAGIEEPIELYDLARDPGEQRDVAAKYPTLAVAAGEILRAAHTDAPQWRAFGPASDDEG
jgi:arylsulfatase A-like enzyme